MAEPIVALHSGNAPPRLRARVIDAMTTNETYWFRNPGHFDELRQALLPAWMDSHVSELRIWSAACSTGQEPYSLGLCVAEFFRCGGGRKPVHILGTDLSHTAMAEAMVASDTEMALSRGLDGALKARYFDARSDRWLLKPEITGRIRLQYLNLLDSYAALGRFDAVFCRNALIDFPEPVKRDILLRLARTLNPGGCLFLSSTESLPADVGVYERVRGLHCWYYQVKEGMAG